MTFFWFNDNEKCRQESRFQYKQIQGSGTSSHALNHPTPPDLPSPRISPTITPASGVLLSVSRIKREVGATTVNANAAPATVSK